MNILLLVGIAIFFGTSGGKIFQKLKIPQVVGYIIIGVLLGESFFGVLEKSTIETLTPIINITLGIIGFRIGAELNTEVFRKYGRSIYTILFSEGLFTFFIVTLFVTFITKKLYLGLLFGALASATAPAATTDVLWEYKTRGPLTTTLLSVVALDDALSLIIYGFASVLAKSMLVRGVNFSIFHNIGVPIFELSQSCILGAVAGYGLSRLLCHVKSREYLLSFTLGAIILTIGVSVFLGLDLILSTMVLGAVIANLVPQVNRRISESIESSVSPLYVLFFVLVGARLQAKLFLEINIALLAIIYLISRTTGKMVGAYFGGLISKAKKTVTKYLGLCLFSQAGVAIGLAMVIYHNFGLLGPEGKQVGLLVVNVITATTFVVQIIGPPCVKFAITKSGEVFRNVTKEDIIESYKVSDMMYKDFSSIREDATLDKIIETVKERESYHFPVVNNRNELVGLISLGNLRSTFSEEQLNKIVLAKDVAEPVGVVLHQDQPLKEAFEIFDRRGIDCLPVTKDKDSKEVVGILEYRPLVEAVNRKLLERQQDIEK
jgi:Kef-type K+ transport system membrane component KefB/CBS domain-containing protein